MQHLASKGTKHGATSGAYVTDLIDPAGELSCPDHEGPKLTTVTKRYPCNPNFRVIDMVGELGHFNSFRISQMVHVA